MSLVPIRRAILSIAAILVLASGAHAELGGPVSSVKVDGGRMGARMASLSMRGYARHDLTRGNGGLVHEFSNASGQVFAVTWSGPGKPDLRTVLGKYFGPYQASAGGGVGRVRHALRRPAQVDQADLQIQTAGHMGWFHGVAYIPSLAPAGFSTADLPVQP
ncbi:DUF2844 domain-containing protein [Sphingomonas bacterium]|uniref:DUF2844 domain-containing protein n=1 Tax=Sphingomonas bacterium TaxID=1895847 RepID=UPI001575065A|nr:DUF2844 domain-containing protein [Sphingomonas bacterium]